MDRFYRYVPKDVVANLKYRLALRKAAARDKKLRRAITVACKNDMLFFCNALAWLYEPRPRFVDGREMPREIPFVTWPHQDRCIRTIEQHLGTEDIGLEKSRGEGGSWIAVLFALRDWLFEDLSAVGLVSRIEAAVDNPEDPDSLMWKMDWELTKLPRWMVPDFKRNLQEHTLRNLENGSTITGYAATADVGSGGRKRWFLMDELAKFPRGPDKEAMASTQHVTDCRFVVSTPKGSTGAYYDLMHEPSSMVKIVLDWKDNPFRNEGLYHVEKGQLVGAPQGYAEQAKELLGRLERKGFRLEGRPRSPWYDHQCDRPGATPQNVAQELDRDYGGSVYRIFGSEFVASAEKTIRPPFVRGLLDFHPERLTADFDPSEDGPCLLWCNLDVKHRPPRHPYVVGADISAGLGGSFSSNSAAIAVDMVTKEQVCEYVSNAIQPVDFADFCIALCKWFHDAFLIWEHNGPGSAFTSRVKDRRYGNIFYRTILGRRGRAKTKDLGWWTDERTKETMFGDLIRAVRAGELKLRSRAVLDECGQYVRGATGKIVHAGVQATKDESSKGQSHGDRVIAQCLALQGIKDRPLFRDIAPGPQSIPPGCMAERQRAHEESLRAKSSSWDSRSNWDMILSA